MTKILTEDFTITLQILIILAASVMMTLPVIALFFAGQRYFVQGVVMSGIKG